MGKAVYKMLVLNPGSTSTKVAVYENDQPVFVRSVTHTEKDLAEFTKVADQYDYRRNLVMQMLKENGVRLSDLDAVVSRGGLFAPIQGGAYEVNEDMVWKFRNEPMADHASNIGALIAYSLKQELGIPAFIYDGITVDEMDEVNRITGLPGIERSGFCHTLNTRAAARRWAAENGRAYEDVTVIVAHLGGGITINLHTNGYIADVVSDDEGPFSPERAGGLPAVEFSKLCFSGKYTLTEVNRLLNRKGGLNAYFGTKDTREVEAMADAGDTKAALVYEAMALAIAKNIAKLAPDVAGRVDAVILTGGIAHSARITDYVKERVEFIAPVTVYPGEDEMLALANGCLRVLKGQESARIYTR